MWETDGVPSQTVKKEAEDIQDIDEAPVTIKHEEIDIDCKTTIKKETFEHHDDYDIRTNTFATDAKEKIHVKVMSKTPRPIPSILPTITIKKEDMDDVGITIKEENVEIPSSNDDDHEKKTNTLATDHSVRRRVLYCEKCNYCTFWATELEQHEIGHNKFKEEGKDGVTLQKCNVCNYETKRKKYFAQHQKTHLSMDEVQHYTCETCGFRTKTKRNFQGHLKRHLGIDQVVSYECDFQTKLNRSLKYLKKEHLSFKKDKYYHCESCSYRTHDHSSLKIHLIVHKKPDELTMYKCDKCNYQTKHNGCLIQHKRTHV